VENQVVIITGGGQGIGFGIGKCFARQGATIAVADVNLDGARQAATELNSLGALNSIGLACDVTHRDQVVAMVEEVEKTYGRIDVLVNNAGVCPFVHIMEMSPEMWQRTLDVNLTGAFHCTQAVAEKMIARGQGGRIIFITSLAENVTGPAQVDYGASKAGLRMTMVGFSTALGPHGITCNAIAPGMILTALTAHHWTQPGPAEQIKTRVPMGRIGTPEDIGHAAVFLASPQAEYISGITLRVDGGHQACCV
jgi:NAD(P)-dependent dehydrogenase (short-subunit alcohol dehydrogenase family)